jgi:hypothetical protein
MTQQNPDVLLVSQDGLIVSAVPANIKTAEIFSVFSNGRFRSISDYNLETASRRGMKVRPFLDMIAARGLKAKETVIP